MNFEEQINILTYFNFKMEANAFIILQIQFFEKRAGLTIGEYHSDVAQFSRGTFSHVMRLDQLRASETV